MVLGTGLAESCVAWCAPIVSALCRADQVPAQNARRALQQHLEARTEELRSLQQLGSVVDTMSPSASKGQAVVAHKLTHSPSLCSAAALAGKSVLMLDANPYFGSHGASLNLEEFMTWYQAQAAPSAQPVPVPSASPQHTPDSLACQPKTSPAAAAEETTDGIRAHGSPREVSAPAPGPAECGLDAVECGLGTVASSGSASNRAVSCTVARIVTNMASYVIGHELPGAPRDYSIDLAHQVCRLCAWAPVSQSLDSTLKRPFFNTCQKLGARFVTNSTSVAIDRSRKHICVQCSWHQEALVRLPDDL